VERGQTYTFVVEGGNDRTNPAHYHPFYITDSSEGGFGQKSEAEQKKQRVFGGVNYDSDGYPYPTAGESLVYLVVMTNVEMTNAPSDQRGTAVAQWLRCCATNGKVAGSIPSGVSGFFIDIKSFRSHHGPGVDSASNRNEYQEYFLGVKAAGA